MACIAAARRGVFSLVVVAAMGLSLQACTKNEVDGVPNVADVKNIVINGETLTPRQFLDKYCLQHQMNETCAAVAMQSQMNALVRKK
jgi:hypothetical protein